MNILLIGSGGREHAIAEALHRSKSTADLYCAPGNPGIFEYADKAEINIEKFDEIGNFVNDHHIDLIVVGPEQPLADGITDYMALLGIKVFGPVQKAALLESSKDFAKQIMEKYNIPTAGYSTFTAEQRDDAHRYIDGHSLPVVLKADGLAAGKGVIIAENHKTAHEALDSLFGGSFGDAGSKVVIEEFMDGEEASVFAITDGNDYITLVPSQDHKRAFDDDKGPNTGGMGAYAPAPIANHDVISKVKTEIIEPLLHGMSDEGIVYRGCLYCGLMIKNGQPKVVEFNVRFGDPETQAVLPLIKGDFAKLLYSAAEGGLDKESVYIDEHKAACCVVLASEGYPGSYKKGFPISGLYSVKTEDLYIFHAGTASVDSKIVTDGGRVLGITAIDDNLGSAVTKAYSVVDKIDFENKFYRKDIAQKAL